MARASGHLWAACARRFRWRGCGAAAKGIAEDEAEAEAEAAAHADGEEAMRVLQAEAWPER